MGNIRQHNGRLFFDFRIRGIRCREQTTLDDTPANRKRMQKVLNCIERAIVAGTFRYADFFPGSKLAKKFTGHTSQVTAPCSNSAPNAGTPPSREFVEDWFAESLPAWRRSHAATVRSTLDRHVVRFFGDMAVGDIKKADILRFRALVSQQKGRGDNTTTSAKTINRIVQILSQIQAETAERYDFINPAERIKRLKQRHIDIHPLSLAETRQRNVSTSYRQLLFR